MNILYLNHYAGSPEMGMEYRPYYLSREWVKMGHRVTIVAGDYSHLRQKNPTVAEDFQSVDIDGITYCWVKTGVYEGNGAARAMSMFRFVSKLCTHAEALIERCQPDVVIASSTYPLDTYAAQRIAKLSGATYVHEVHDMWPITLIELGGMSRTHPFVVLTQMAEDSFCKHADRVVAFSPAPKGYFAEHGMPDDRFACVSNGVVSSEWEHPVELSDDVQARLSRFAEAHKTTICFFGSHTRSYAISYLIEAIQRLDDESVGAVFVGNGNQKDELIKLSQRSHSSRFLFLPSIPKLAIPALLEQIDVIYIGALRNDMFRFGISMNKLFDSMMSGRPILYAVEAPNNYIADYKCGLTVEPESVDALIEGILVMTEFSKEDLNKVGSNGRAAALQYFTYERLAEQFIEVIESC